MAFSNISSSLLPHPLLVVGKNELLQQSLQPLLQQGIYRMFVADTTAAALALLAQYPMVAVLLNVNTPGSDVYTLCTELRKKSLLPMIMVSTEKNADELVAGLEAGADYYMTLPFTSEELIVRIQATQRRMKQPTVAEHFIPYGTILLDPVKQKACINRKVIDLTSNECRLLHYLVRNPNRAIRTNDLLRRIWGYESHEDINIVRITVHRLRNKIEQDPGSPRYLKTIFGLGYRFCPTP